MNIRLKNLVLHTRKTVERIEFSPSVTFIHGPIGKGKSTVARLVDYCLGGKLERTPAIRHEFVAAELSLVLGCHDCLIERGSEDTQGVRLTWSAMNDVYGSVFAPFRAEEERLIEADVYNFSDLFFFLCGITPIKVRQRLRDPDSPLVRLSIRDIWRYCYLDQTHLDSSFFKLEDAQRGRKSQDAMRFITGLHSDRLDQIEMELVSTLDEQRSKRATVLQIREMMKRFEFGTESDIDSKIRQAELELAKSQSKRTSLELLRTVQTHPTDSLRDELRQLGTDIENRRQSLLDSIEALDQQQSLRAEFITAKTKSARADQAIKILDGVSYQRCPECGNDISYRKNETDFCRLCHCCTHNSSITANAEQEIFRRDLNERIDQITDAIRRRKFEVDRARRQIILLENQKNLLDQQLQNELARYDSAFIESIRGVERDIAMLSERISSLKSLQQMPLAINSLEVEAGALQGRIDLLRSSIADERNKLRGADRIISEVASEFKRIMIAAAFPGVSAADDVIIDPRNWRPMVLHHEQEWGFWDTGSGGKKTLFNVCYALALHSVASNRGLPLPDTLIIDSPTKNISEDENPELVRSLYDEIYRLANRVSERKIQLLLIDSEFVAPRETMAGLLVRRMAGEPDAPSLIPYYTGP